MIMSPQAGSPFSIFLLLVTMVGSIRTSLRSLLMQSIHRFAVRPRGLMPSICKLRIFFGHRSVFLRWTCPYHHRRPHLITSPTSGRPRRRLNSDIDLLSESLAEHVHLIMALSLRVRRLMSFVGQVSLAYSKTLRTRAF